MSGGVLDKVAQQTQLAGHNRVALLLFGLGDAQHFGLNVFKVRELMRRPSLERPVNAHELVVGSFDYRGQTVPVIDLAASIGYPPLRDDADAHIMVCEFSRAMQAFLVKDVRRIVHCDGESLSAPPPALGLGASTTAITRVDGALVAIVDVEHVLARLSPTPVELSLSTRRAADAAVTGPRRVLVVDDSLVARNRIVALLDQLQIENEVAADGQAGLDRLLAVQGVDGERPFDLVISDIEMPVMDGYALTRAIRDTPQLRQMKVLLHSSISGLFNEALVREVNADCFIPKFHPDDLAEAVIKMIHVA